VQSALGEKAIIQKSAAGWRDFNNSPGRVVGCFDAGFRCPPLEKQIPRARKKALGMTKSKKLYPTTLEGDSTEIRDDPGRAKDWAQADLRQCLFPFFFLRSSSDPTRAAKS
jgi:hypothetical protein